MMLERYTPLLLIAVLSLCLSVTPSLGYADVFELRTYTTNENKLDDLHARFRDHTVKLFERHGIQSVGYWVPTDEEKSKNTLIYVIRHANREAAQQSWKNFRADPEWKEVYRKSEADGQILARRPESVYMNLTEYSPAAFSTKAGNDSVYELRIYRTNPGKLANLNARFRDHTMRIFQKHGIENVAYWVPADEPDSEDTLIYIIRHQSRAAAEKSWAAFCEDEDWKKVAAESQKDGRFLRERPESIYMKPTDYSALQ